MKKPKQLILGIIASWFAFIAIDSTAGIFFKFNNRKMKEPAKTIYSIIVATRAVIIFLLAFLTFFSLFFCLKNSYTRV